MNEVLDLLEYCNQYDFDLIVIKFAGDFEGEKFYDIKQLDAHAIETITSKYNYFSLFSLYDDYSIKPRKCWSITYFCNLLVRSNGDVFLCTVSPYTDKNTIGINNNKLRDIWGSSSHFKIINKLNRDMLNGICNISICRHYRYNWALEKYFAKRITKSSGHSSPVLL